MDFGIKQRQKCLQRTVPKMDYHLIFINHDQIQKEAYDTTFKKNANESGDPIVKCKAVNTEAASVLKLICIVKLVQRHASSNDKNERGGGGKGIFSVFSKSIYH